MSLVAPSLRFERIVAWRISLYLDYNTDKDFQKHNIQKLSQQNLIIKIDITICHYSN